MFENDWAQASKSSDCAGDMVVSLLQRRSLTWIGLVAIASAVAIIWQGDQTCRPAAT